MALEGDPGETAEVEIIFRRAHSGNTMLLHYRSHGTNRLGIAELDLVARRRPLAVALPPVDAGKVTGQKQKDPAKQLTLEANLDRESSGIPAEGRFAARRDLRAVA